MARKTNKELRQEIEQMQATIQRAPGPLVLSLGIERLTGKVTSSTNAATVGDLRMLLEGLEIQKSAILQRLEQAAQQVENGAIQEN